MSKLVTLAALFALALPAGAFAQAGTLDTTFSGDGQVVTTLTTGLDFASEVVVQTDGKIVVVGQTSGQGTRVGLVRYNADGSFDTTFSGDGKVFTNITRGREFGLDVALQPDGKILVSGGIGLLGGRCGIFRYDTNGSLDPTFSGDGRQAINFTAGWDSCYDTLVQTDGKIVTGGVAAGQGTRATLLRLNENGSLDPTFSGDGKLIRNFSNRTDYFDALALQADGKIVAAGTADWDRRPSRLILARYNTDGSPDTGFSGDGVIQLNTSAPFDGAYAVTIQADQAIVVGGQVGQRMIVLRYLPDGTPDLTFSGDGRVVTEVAPTLDYAEDIEVQSDGKIVVGGSAAYFRRDSKFLVARYDSVGLLDPTFSGDGKLLINFTTSTDEGYGTALDADGKLIIAGVTAGQGGRFALARVNDE